MIVWVGFGILFLVYETYAIATKEKTVPTLSRTIWRLTSWRVTVYRPGPPDPRPFEDGEPVLWFTFRPLRIALFGFMVWLTIHFTGECALGVCK